MGKHQSRRAHRQSIQTKSELEDKIPAGPVTPEFRQHHSVKIETVATDRLGFTTVAQQVVKDKYSNLVEDGTLTLAEATAARKLRTYADNYFSGIVGPYQMRVDGSSRPGEGMINKIAYAQKVQRALDHLNSELRKVAVTYILDGHVPHMGHSFISIGQSYFGNVKDEERVRIAGKALVIATCRELAVHFQFQNGYEFDVTKGVAGVRVGKVRAAREPDAQEV